MITGAHTIIYSTNAIADKEFFKNVLNFNYIDAGHGWLIFALPPSEVAIHPSDENGRSGFYLLCDDVHAFIIEMAEKEVVCSPVETQRWGLITHLTLPGGGELAVYEPKHARP